jgi:hypothetical protein
MKAKTQFKALVGAALLFTVLACERAVEEPIVKTKGIAKDVPISSDDPLLLHAGSTRGSVNGPALQAQFDSPLLIAAGPDQSLYVYDKGSHFEIDVNHPENKKIRKIIADGTVTTLLDLSTFGLLSIQGMAVNKNGEIFISNNHQIKKIDPEGKHITIVAGTGEGHEAPMKDGPALKSTFLAPAGLVFNKEGCLFIIDKGNNAVRRLTNNQVTTIAGGIRDYEEGDISPDEPPKDGIGSQAEFDNPEFIAVDNNDNLYVTGGKFRLIRKVTPTGVVTNFLGNEVDYDSDYYSTFTGITFANGKLYVNSNSANGKLAPFHFSVNELPLTGVLSPLVSRTYSQEYPETNVPGLYFPTGLCTIGNTLYIAVTSEHQIRKLIIN